jgi:hypothetical protein
MKLTISARWLTLLPPLVACTATGTAGPDPVSPREIRPEMVTGEAALALGADGRFRFSLPAAELGEVPLDTANDQALEFAKYVTNNLLLRGVVEAGRGGYWTDPHLLDLCPDEVHYVRPQLGALPVDSLPDDLAVTPLRKFGPQWLLPLCGDDAEPQMTVQVALRANLVRFRSGQLVEPEPYLLSAFSPQGVPWQWPDALPLSAERAARFAYDQTGARIARVPELFLRGDTDSQGTYDLQAGAARNCSRWRIVLDREVSMQRGVGSPVRSTTEVYVATISCSGSDITPTLQLPIEGQVASVTVRLTDFDATPARQYALDVPVVSPIRFELVQAIR